MAFTRGYKHDVFISYAHADDRPFEGAGRGWVRTFASDLQTALSQRLRCDAAIWFDHKELKSNIPLTSAIMQALNETATFIVVFSHRYLASEWCGREREAFLRLIKARAGGGSRMFKVEIDGIETGGDAPGTKVRAEFGDLIGVRFWKKDFDDRVPKTLGWPLPDPLRDRDYYDRIKSLSYDLAEELERISAGVVPEAAAHMPKTAVYLAEVTDDLDGKREKIKSHLKQFGLTVLPKTWRAYDDLTAYQNAVDEDLSKCRLFVQLLSGVVGKRPFGQPLGYPRLQYDRAAAAGKHILQWHDEALDFEEADADLRALLEGETVRAESFETFKKAVVDAATAPTEEKKKLSGKFAFISTDTTDRARAEALVCTSLKRRGIGYTITPPQGDPGTTRKFVELSLSDCVAALVVYGETDIYTVLDQTLQCQKIILQRAPTPSLAVFDAPPPNTRGPLPFNFDNLIHLDCRQDPAALDKFLDSL